jgi:hypothetical protein
MGPWESKPAEVRADAGAWISGPQEPETDEQKLARMRGEYPDASIFRIAGGWGAVVNVTEWAATGNTLDELDEKLGSYFE